MDIARKEMSRFLRETADKLDANTSEIDDDQLLRAAQLFAHQKMTKEEAALHLHIWPSRFDTLIREGKLPKGRKKLGQKNKVWYLDEIENSEYVKSLTK